MDEKFIQIEIIQNDSPKNELIGLTNYGRIFKYVNNNWVEINSPDFYKSDL